MEDLRKHQNALRPLLQSLLRIFLITLLIFNQEDAKF